MDPFLAEIRIFPFNFPPKGWAFCDGQVLPVQQNTALFSLIGTTYGGNGVTTFALPDLQGQVPIHAGQGPGLSDFVPGERTGSETVALVPNQLPGHSHTLNAENPAISGADQSAPSTTSVLAQSSGGFAYAASAATAPVAMNPSAVSSLGGGQPHNNVQPYLTLNFCIALQGIFPARS